MSESGPGTVRLTLVLAFFFVAGAGMTLIIWHTLSDFLAGQPVEGGAIYWLWPSPASSRRPPTPSDG